EKPGMLDTNLWVGDRTGPKARVDIPSDAMGQAHRDWLAVKPRTAWTIGETTHASDTVLGISLSAFLAGDRRFTTLFQPRPRRALQGFFWCGGRLVLWILDALEPVFEVLLPAAGEWRRERIAGLPQIGSVNVWPLDQRIEESNGDLLALAHDPLTPPSLFLIQPDAAPALLKQDPPAFDPARPRITRHEAVSSDGEKIPYVQVGPPGETGEAPVHMYGYGGFAASMTANYNSAIGKVWLERGGTSVITHLRGGGEFGTAWHEAGRRAGRRLAHDDFAAVAADLVRRGGTRPRRVAAEGGPHGGLLVAHTLPRYPERFGALFCTLPVIDMRRSPKLPAGAWWIDEYGDPDKPEDWRFLAEISAYHVAAPGKRYPPILLATSRRDDRVHPAHARKMAMKLQAMGYDACFYEPASAAHASAKATLERAPFMAWGCTSLGEKMGWREAHEGR